MVDKNYDGLKVEYGSGLHSMAKAKSPLCRNLVFTPVGDAHSDVECDDIDCIDDETNDD